MSDNLHDTRGCFLIPEHQTQIQAALHVGTQASMDALIKIINENVNPFKFINTHASGSQAVQWCIIQTSKISIEHILFECGSYVSGDDNSCFPSLLTSTLIEKHGKIKTEDIDPMALKRTVPFPHYIP
eukprot:14192570-Ditylum_brightwellii.AAC.1